LSETYSGMRVVTATDRVNVERITREAEILVAIDFGAPREPGLSTSIAFFDHMLEMLGWYADVAVDATYAHTTFRLTHVVCEDIGLALGAAAAAMVRERIAGGVESTGFGHGIMDEARALAHVSFEGRSNHSVVRDAPGSRDSHVEDMLSADLVAFFEGFAQGGRCTVHLRLEQGIDPHHTWEAGFRAFGRALRECWRENPRRAGRTAGVKGTLD
jgi:imidazoleglycerol-phosphate dehydratase